MLRFRYLIPIFRLILMGVLLGLSARLFLGKPVTPEEQDRQFRHSLDETRLTAPIESPNFSLLPDPGE